MSWYPSMVSHTPVKFGDHRHCGGGSCHDDVTTTCLLNFIWANYSAGTCLPNLVVIGLMGKMRYQFLYQFLWIPRKKLNSPSPSAILRDFQNSGVPIYYSEVRYTAGRKTRIRIRTSAIAKRYAFHANVSST